MAFITFYHATEIDIEQLSAGLIETDHHWEYDSEPLTTANIKPESEVISVSCGNPIPVSIIDSFPALRLIAIRCHDFSLVDLDRTKERGISVVYVPEELGSLHETINHTTDESIIGYWYGQTPYLVSQTQNTATE